VQTQNNENCLLGARLQRSRGAPLKSHSVLVYPYSGHLSTRSRHIGAVLATPPQRCRAAPRWQP
jgi:hypothetical protein